MKNVISGMVLTSLAVASMAQAAAPDSTANAKNAAIHFADKGGIYDYRAINSRELYIQSRDRTWYKAELAGPCDGLEYATGIGFMAEPGGDFSRFGHVLVKDQRCPVTSLVAIEGKPPK